MVDSTRESRVRPCRSLPVCLLSILLLAPGAELASAQVEYERVPTLPLGDSTFRYTWADATGDGVSDLVAAHTTLGQVAIYPRASAGFWLPTIVVLVAQPTAVAVADFDQDGLPDLAIRSSNGIAVRRGLGSSTFAISGPLLAVDSGSSFIAMDLDLDGFPDIASIDSIGDAELAVFPNLAGLQFGPRVSVSLPGTPTHLIAADSDGSGPELFVTMSGQIFVFSYLGSSLTYRAGYSVPGARATAPADFDGDGNLDLAVLRANPDRVQVLLGDGTVSFVAGAIEPCNYDWSIVAGDFDADGAMDVVVEGDFLRGNGNGTLTRVRDLRFGLGLPDLPAPALFPIVVDLDRDGRDDLLTAANYPGGYSAGFLLGGSDAFAEAASAVKVGLQTRSFAVVDLTGDGRDDIVTANFTEGLTLYESNLDGFPVPRAQTGGSHWAVVSSDVDGDGQPEVVASSTSQTRAWRWDGLTLVPGSVFGPSLSGLQHVIDVNGDGRVDLVGVAAFGGIEVSLRNATQDFWEPSVVQAAAVDVNKLAPIDVDADGDLDLVGVEEGSFPRLVLFTNDGAGAFTIGTVIDPPFAVTDCEPLDVDRDGLADLVTSPQFETSPGRWFRNLGGGNFDAPVDLMTPGSPVRDLIVGDLDQDGFEDLAFATNRRELIAYAGNGVDFDPAVEFGPEAGVLTLDQPPTPRPDVTRLGDVDGDGLIDLVLLGDQDFVSVLYNRTQAFLRGDLDGNSALEITDVIVLLDQLFASAPPNPCEDVGDANDDGSVDVADAVALLAYLFIPGAAIIPSPFPDCGTDPTFDALDCVPTPCP